MSDYNKYSRPARTENQSLEVKFGLSMNQIIDLVRGMELRIESTTDTIHTMLYSLYYTVFSVCHGYVCYK